MATSGGNLCLQRDIVGQNHTLIDLGPIISQRGDIVCIGTNVSATLASQSICVGHTLSDNGGTRAVVLGTQSGALLGSTDTVTLGHQLTTGGSIVVNIGVLNTVPALSSYVHCLGDNNTLTALTQACVLGTANIVSAVSSTGVFLAGVGNALSGTGRTDIVIVGNTNDIKGDSTRVTIVGHSNNITVVNESTLVLGNSNYIAIASPTIQPVEPIIIGNRNAHVGSFGIFLGNGNTNYTGVGSVILIGMTNTTDVDTDSAIGIGYGCQVTGEGAIAMGYGAVANAHEVVFGDYDPLDIIDGAYHTFIVRGHNLAYNVAVDTLKVIDNPAAGTVGLFVTYDTGATVVSKQVKAAVTPPVGALLLYIEP